MASRDGNGWVRCSLGHRHWGKFGAAGLLAYAGGSADPGGHPPDPPANPGETQVLLQRRVAWSHYGGTWGLPGGAADSHETPVEAALREAAEECGVPPDAVVVHGIYIDDHGGWAYHTVFARAAAPFAAYPASEETDDVDWVPADRAAELDLHPGLAAHWAELRAGLLPLTVIVDGANVVGSRPDGWWRDRAGAARRLVAGVTALAGAGVTGVPAGLGLPSPARWLPDYVVVLEGQAKAAVRSGLDGAGPDGAGLDGGGRVRVVGAPGSGDDTIAELAGELPGRRLVVTADRELRGRCEAAGALVTGPRWLTERLDG
jgi:8-oxo-dGTP diphosphatase